MNIEWDLHLWFDQLRFDQNDAKYDLNSDLDLYLWVVLAEWALNIKNQSSQDRNTQTVKKEHQC